MSDAPPETPRARTAPAPRPRAPRPIWARALDVLGSFGLAVTLLLMLMLLTALGTFAQAHTSLLDVQRKYFESVILVEDVGPISIPLPGGALCLGVLAVNLIVGGLIRIRKGVATLGIMVGHVGILLLLGGSLVEYLVSDKGQMALDPGSAASHFQSYHDWDLVLRERRTDGTALEWTVPHERLADLEPRDTLHVHTSALPFTATLTDWMRNGTPARAADRGVGAGGWVGEPKKPAKEAEHNVPCVLLAIRAQAGAPPVASALLWGGARWPWSFEVAGRRFEAALRRQRWELPFALRLDRFEKEDHPGISMAKRFSSYVTKLEGGAEQKVHITMNEPLRHRGYIFYQSNWGPQDPDLPPGTPLYSVFSVVRNPSDRIPWLAWSVIVVGLLTHFGRRLVLHMRAEARRPSPGGAGAELARPFRSPPDLAGRTSAGEPR